MMILRRGAVSYERGTHIGVLVVSGVHLARAAAAGPAGDGELSSSRGKGSKGRN